MKKEEASLVKEHQNGREKQSAKLFLEVRRIVQELSTRRGENGKKNLKKMSRGEEKIPRFRGKELGIKRKGGGCTLITKNINFPHI